MAKVILIYGSTTGNTETLSEGVVEGLKQGGVEVTVKDVTEVNVNELTQYDLIVLGCSSWGTGGEDKNEMLQEDFRDFYHEMDDISLNGLKAAVFGPGDSEMWGEEEFCKAVDYIEEKLIERGADLITKSFKVDGDVEPAMDDAKTWGLKIAESL